MLVSVGCRSCGDHVEIQISPSTSQRLQLKTPCFTAAASPGDDLVRYRLTLLGIARLERGQRPWR